MFQRAVKMKSIFHAAAFPAEREKRTEKNKTEIRQFVQITQVSPSIYFIKKQQQKEGETVSATPFKLRLSKVATPFTLTFLSLSLSLLLIVSRLSFNAFRFSQANWAQKHFQFN